MKACGKHKGNADFTCPQCIIAEQGSGIDAIAQQQFGMPKLDSPIQVWVFAYVIDASGGFIWDKTDEGLIKSIKESFIDPEIRITLEYFDKVSVFENEGQWGSINDQVEDYLVNHVWN